MTKIMCKRSTIGGHLQIEMMDTGIGLFRLLLDRIDNSNSKSGLIMGCVVAALLTVVGLMALLRIGVSLRKSTAHRVSISFFAA